MAGESNADVYASFGVNSAVLTGSTPEEHQENMLALDVAARDGDDAIELNTNSDDPYGSVSPLTVQTNRMAKKVLKKNRMATKGVSWRK